MTLRTNARLAGFMFLFYIASGIGGMLLFLPTNRGEGTAARLASLAQHETLARFAAVESLVMMLNAIVLGVALYALVRDVDRDLALLALGCRFAEGVIGGMSAFPKRALVIIATQTSENAQAATALATVILKLQGLTTLLGASMFAVGSTIICWLFIRGRVVPAALAWLGLAASILLLVCLPLRLGGVLDGPVAMGAWAPMAIFEVTLGIWLLMRADRLPTPAAVSAAAFPAPREAGTL